MASLGLAAPQLVPASLYETYALGQSISEAFTSRTSMSGSDSVGKLRLALDVTRLYSKSLDTSELA